MEMLDQSAAVGPLPDAQSAVATASGLIGADWLRDFDVEFDLRRRRVTLYRVAGCGGDYVPWQGRRTSVIAQVCRHAHPGDDRAREAQHRTARHASPVTSISTLRVTTADMLLGADWLRGNRVWISYAAHRVTIQPYPPDG